MKFSKLNIILSIGLLALLGVLIMQVSMLRRAFVFEKNEFSDKIHFALSDVVKKIYQSNQNELPLSNQIQKVADDYYMVNVNDHFDDQVLEFFLKTQFEKINLNTDYEYAIYDCGTDQMVYGNYVSNKKEITKCVECFKVNPELTYYFAVRFPHLKYNLFESLWYYWILFGVILIILVIYVYSFLVLIKQKKYTAIQNDFINNMTHEFKTPLSSILLASNYLKNNKNSHEEKIEQYANMIHSQGLKLNQHIETLLRVAKSDSSQIDLQKSWINLNDLVIEIKFDIQLRHPQITLNSDIKPSLSVYADAFHLKNILTNFVDNAIKYNTDHVRVTLSAKETSKGLEIACVDNGIGIEKTHLPYIFDKFYRIPRENNKDIIGFGLGLFYSKKMANLHFWQIKAENESTNGLKIYLLLSKKDYKYE